MCIAFESIRQALGKDLPVWRCRLTPKGIVMKVFASLAFLLVATAAHADETVTITRSGNSVTVTGPNGTATTTETSRSANSATFTTTVNRGGGASYQPMGSGGY